MTATFALARFHFLLRPSRPALIFALRTTATALLALVVAVLLGLDSPHWAAMTVWIVAQPTRGMVVSKGLYRLAGTVIGSAFAAQIVLLFGHAPLYLAGSLAIWVGACAAVGAVLRGFRSYGALLAGYSAALVALLGLPHPDAIVNLAISRVILVAIGIVVSAAVTVIFVPGSSARDLLVRARALSRDTLRWAEQSLTSGRSDDLAAQQHRLVAEMADINTLADHAAAGSVDLQARINHVRALISHLLAFMARMRALSTRDPAANRQLATVLAQAAGGALRQPMDAFAPWPDIRQSLDGVAMSYRALARPADSPATLPAIGFNDWKAAAVIGLRAFAGVATVGVLWVASGWRDGPQMLMATAIMCSVFAAADAPSHNVLQAMKGATLAVAAAFLCAFVALHGAAATLPAAIAVMAPFMVLGGLAMANRATIIPGTDFSMVFLLLSQPGVPASAHGGQLFDNALGIVSGMAAAALINRVGVPASPARRLDALTAEIVRDLEALAASRRAIAAQRWRNKACHRILRLVLRAGQTDENPAERLEGGLAALIVGAGIERLRTVLADPAMPSASASLLRPVLEQLRSIHRNPRQTAIDLGAAAERLGETQPDRKAAAALMDIAEALAANPEFFKA